MNKKDKESIAALKRHEDISERLDYGLNGTTFLEHFMWVVEGVLKKNPKDGVLKAGYKVLEREYSKMGKGLDVDVSTFGPKALEQQRLYGN